ncbi:MAG TPA: hypothetical protein VFF48_03885 [Brevundimonas sp.]|nr:hypothetical protein [Brevundimonas sp.]
MTVFGRTLDGQEIASLVFMLLVLVLWIGALRKERGWKSWINRSPEGRDARRSAGVDVKEPAPPAAPGPRDPRRPWG